MVAMKDDQLLVLSPSVETGKFQRLEEGGQAEEYEAGDTRGVRDDCILKSYRKWIVLITTVAMIITFATQTSMSSALVCMIPAGDHLGIPVAIDNRTTTTTTTTTTTVDALLLWIFLVLVFTGLFNYFVIYLLFIPLQKWHLVWDKNSQGWVLSSFFIGYSLTQVPSGIASTRWGPKRVLVVSLFLISVLQALAVPAAYFGLAFLYTDRFLAGVVCGLIYAPGLACAGQWIPRHEVNLLFGIIGSGMELGIMLSFLISTFACEINVQGGWPFIFYILAALGAITTLLIVVFVSDSPFSNRFISSQELEYISKSVPKPVSKDKVLAEIPVKAILTSMPVWAIIVSQIGSDWLYYFLVTVTPLYLKEVVQLTEMQTNLLFGIPFLFILPVIYISGYVSDRLVSRGKVTMTNMRKIGDFFCKIIPGGAMVAIGFAPTGATTLVFLLNTVAAIFLAFSYVSWLTNPVDIAGGYTGFVVGLCEGLVKWITVIIPVVTEAVTVDKTREQWQMMFYATGALQVVSYGFYLVFASGELQPWAKSTFEGLSDDVDNRKGRRLSVSQAVPRRGSGSTHEFGDVTMGRCRRNSAVDPSPESGLPDGRGRDRSASDTSVRNQSYATLPMDSFSTGLNGAVEVSNSADRSSKAETEKSPLIKK